MSNNDNNADISTLCNSPPLPLVTVALPILGSICGIATIVAVYFVTWINGHLPDGATTPPISLLGCNPPEHGIYQIGFSLTGLLLWGAIEAWRQTIYIRLKHELGNIPSLFMLVGAYMAVVGVIGQGIVTLEEDLWDHLKAGRRGLAPQSIYHQQFAAIFFLGAALHCYTTIYYILAATASTTITKSWRTSSSTTIPETAATTTATTTTTTKRTSRCCYGTWSIRVKILTVLTSLGCWPIAELLHPARTTSLDKRNLNIGGLAQYIAVVSYIVFFGSYTLDFATLSFASSSSSISNQSKSSKKDKEA